MKTILPIALVAASIFPAAAQTVIINDPGYYNPPVAYQVPVVYNAPVVYQAPVVYNAPVVYQPPVYNYGYAGYSPYAACPPAVVPSTVYYFGSGLLQYNTGVCAPISTVHYFGGGGSHHRRYR